MARTNLYLKVEIEHDPEENPQRLALELCRQLRKWHGVREAEVAGVTAIDD